MKLDYLKCMREYLSKTRENLGVAEFSIMKPFDLKCIYGTTASKVLITDVNSIYIINNFHSVDEFFISIFNSNVDRLVNTKYLIDDLFRYPLSLEGVSLSNMNDILADEQRYFYEKLLRGNIQSFYDEKKEVLVGYGDNGCGYVYVPTLKSTNCR